MTQNVIIFGATRGTGYETAKLLCERGDKVTALVRESSDASGLEALGATIVRGNAIEAADVKRALESGVFTAAVNTMGGKRGETPRPDVAGMKNILAAAKPASITRHLLVTAIGSGDSHSAVSPNVHKFLGEVLKLKTEIENMLQESGLDYTILRPGGMTNDPASGTAVKTEDHQVMGMINRADLAALVVECLDDDTTIGKIYHTVDPEISEKPPLERGESLGTDKYTSRDQRSK